MKALLCLVLALCLAGMSCQVHQSTNTAISEAPAVLIRCVELKPLPSKHPGFIFHERLDFRLEFSDLETLKDRIARSVCVLFEFGGPTSGSEEGSALEIPIAKALSVRDILQIRSFRKKWGGGQPQLKIVKRDSILQSSSHCDITTPETNPEIFLQYRLEPGDALVITPRE